MSSLSDNLREGGSEIRKTDLLVCAGLCEGSYGRFPSSAEKLKDINPRPEDDRNTGRVTILRVGEVCVVAFRGTTTPLDILTNINCLANPHTVRGLSMHCGAHARLRAIFKKYFEEIVDVLHQLRGKVDRVIFTGHSLGGAVAAIALMEVLLMQNGLCDEFLSNPDEDRKRLNELPKCLGVALGAPVVLCTDPQELEDRTTAVLEQFRTRMVTVVNANDVVPRLPVHTHLAKRAVIAFAKRGVPTPIVGNFMLGLVDGKLDELVAALDNSVVRGFKHLGTVLHFASGGLIVSDTARLADIDEELDKRHAGNSLLADHAVGQYAMVLTMSDQESHAAGADSQHCIGMLTWETLSTKFVFRANERNLERMGLGEHAHAPARVVSFSGESKVGKSFVITKLQKLDGETPRAHPLVLEEAGVGATTGDVNLFRSSLGLLMDCEGTFGTDNPAAISSTPRLDVLGSRRKAVADTLPRFAMLTSHVFCYVTHSPPDNFRVYDEVRGYADAAWSGINNAAFPTLIVIQNRVSPDACVDNATSLFLKHDKDGNLGRVFGDRVHFVQLPICNENVLFRKPNGEIMSSADLFQERIARLKDLMGSELAHHEQHGLRLSEGLWFSLVRDVCDAIRSGEPVSLAQLVSANKVPEESPFREVLLAAKLVLRCHANQSRDEVVEQFKTALLFLQRYAARLMVHAAEESKISPPDARQFRAIFGKQIEDVREELRALVPCTTVLSEERRKKEELESGSPTPLFCSKPMGYHGTFHSTHNQCTSKKSSWWAKSLFAVFEKAFTFHWEGRHHKNDDLHGELDTLFDGVFALAEAYAAGAIVVQAEPLPQYQLETGFGHKHCFLCCQALRECYWYERLPWTSTQPEYVQLCPDCFSQAENRGLPEEADLGLV